MAGLEDTLSERLGWEPEGRVRFSCSACGVAHVQPVSDVVSTLRVLGLGDERSLISDAAKLATRPCVRCGSARWRASAA